MISVCQDAMPSSEKHPKETIIWKIITVSLEHWSKSNTPFSYHPSSTIINQWYSNLVRHACSSMYDNKCHAFHHASSMHYSFINIILERQRKKNKRT